MPTPMGFLLNRGGVVLWNLATNSAIGMRAWGSSLVGLLLLQSSVTFFWSLELVIDEFGFVDAGFGGRILNKQEMNNRDNWGGSVGRTCSN